MTLHAGMRTPMQWDALQRTIAELKAENARLRQRIAQLELRPSFWRRLLALITQ